MITIKTNNNLTDVVREGFASRKLSVICIRSIIMFLKTKYYPVDLEARKVIDEPTNKEGSLVWKYRGSGLIAIKGDRLNTYDCYADFKILNKNR